MSDTWPQPDDSGPWISAWAGFHDATLKSFAYDEHEQRVTLELDLGFPKHPDHPRPSLKVQCERPSHLLLYIATPFGGEGEALWMTTTISAKGLEELFDEDGADIHNADYRTSNDHPELRLTGHLNDNYWRSIHIHLRSERITILADGTREMTLKQVVSMGEAAWDRWHGRNKA